MSESASGEAGSSCSASDKDFSCDYCGNPFSSQLTKRRHEKNYHPEQLPHDCPDCDTVFHDRRGLHSHHAQKHDGRITGYDRECGICGEAFTTSKKDVQYCSPECGSKAQRNRVSKFCERCGEHFEAPRSRAPLRRFCSLDCKTDWFSEYITKENHPNYKGGRRYYGPTWHSQRRKARKRDQYRCQYCRATAPELDKNPSVHHITPFRDFDDPRRANRLDNLITLCEPCHKLWEGIYLRPDTRG